MNFCDPVSILMLNHTSSAYLDVYNHGLIHKRSEVEQRPLIVDYNNAPNAASEILPFLVIRGLANVDMNDRSYNYERDLEMMPVFDLHKVESFILENEGDVFIRRAGTVRTLKLQDRMFNVSDLECFPNILTLIYSVTPPHEPPTRDTQGPPHELENFRVRELIITPSGRTNIDNCWVDSIVINSNGLDSDQFSPVIVGRGVKPSNGRLNIRENRRGDIQLMVETPDARLVAYNTCRLHILSSDQATVVLDDKWTGASVELVSIFGLVPSLTIVNQSEQAVEFELSGFFGLQLLTCISMYNGTRRVAKLEMPENVVLHPSDSVLDQFDWDQVVEMTPTIRIRPSYP